MKIEKTELERVLLIKPEPFDGDSKEGELFEDERGYFLETYNESGYRDNGININFVEDDISVSKKNVLRGIHGNSETWKLISCVLGKIFFVAVNCDKESPDFGSWQSFELSDNNHLNVLVPPNYGSAYLVLSDKALVTYKQSSYFSPEGRFEYRWDEPAFNIQWPTEAPILSEKDAKTSYIS